MMYLAIGKISPINTEIKHNFETNKKWTLSLIKRQKNFYIITLEWRKWILFTNRIKITMTELEKNVRLYRKKLHAVSNISFGIFFFCWKKKRKDEENMIVRLIWSISYKTYLNWGSRHLDGAYVWSFRFGVFSFYFLLNCYRIVRARFPYYQFHNQRKLSPWHYRVEYQFFQHSQSIAKRKIQKPIKIPPTFPFF